VERSIASCIITQKILYFWVIVLHISIKENQMHAKYYHKYRGTFGLQRYAGVQTKRTGKDEKWGTPVSMLESDYCQASEDLHRLFFLLFKSIISEGHYGSS